MRISTFFFIALSSKSIFADALAIPTCEAGFELYNFACIPITCRTVDIVKLSKIISAISFYREENPSIYIENSLSGTSIIVSMH